MNLGFILVTHGRTGAELVAATEKILGEEIPVLPISVLKSERTQFYQNAITRAIQKTDHGDGVLILTDIFGATPCNLCLQFLKPGKIELVSGVNLPMLLKLNTLPKGMNLSQTAEFLREYGRKNIIQKDQMT